MRTLFIWLDGHPWVYTALAGGSVALALVWAWRARAERSGEAAPWSGRDWQAIVLLGLFLFAWRWPLLWEMSSARAAEPQLLAGAMALAADPMPFRGADLGENGPLAALALLPTHGLGVPQDYFNARFVALLLDWGALALGYALLRRFAARGIAALTLSPFAIGLAASHWPVGYEYSAWHPGLLLMLAAACRIWHPVRAGLVAPARSSWIGDALVLALLPWVSRHGIWMMLGVWLGGWLIERDENGTARQERKRHLWRVAGGTIYLQVAALCLWHGVEAWPQFWSSYARARYPSPDGLGVSWWVWLLAPAVLLGAITLAALMSHRPTLRRFGVPILAGIGGLLLAVNFRAGPPPIVGRLAAIWQQPWSELGRQLRTIRKPADRLAVLGFQPALYVESGMTPAVTALAGLRNDAASVASLLAELRAQKPAYLVETLTQGTENAGSINGTPLAEVRRYVFDFYRLVSNDGRAKSYVRSSKVATASSYVSRMVPLRLAELDVVQATGLISELGESRWFAHAPSVLRAKPPKDALFLHGFLGFLASAYENPSAATNGATFVIEAVATDGRRELLLQRRMTPVENPGDREPVSFKLELPAGLTSIIEFRIEPGEGSAFDWTYWGGLHFERPEGAN